MYVRTLAIPTDKGEATEHVVCFYNVVHNFLFGFDQNIPPLPA